MRIIYKRKKSPTQSGDKTEKFWIIEDISPDKYIKDPLTGWKGTNKKSSMKMKFESKQEAIDYASKYQLKYDVVEENIKTDGAKILIIGRSNLVGLPLSILLLQKKQGANATVTVAHTSTKNIEELIHALEVESSVEDSTESFRDKILNKIFLFDKVRVRDIMIPINRVELLPIDSTIGQAKKIIEKTGFSRLPVYQNKIKNIVGVIHSSYLIGKSDDMKIEEIIEEGLYTNEKSLASKLLNEIRKSKFNLVIVGEKTSASGIVTLEDILEEIVGEIEDEHD